MPGKKPVNKKKKTKNKTQTYVSQPSFGRKMCNDHDCVPEV